MTAGSVALAPAAGSRAGRRIRRIRDRAQHPGNATASHPRGELDYTSAVTVISQENLRYADLYRTSDPELLRRDLLHAHQAPASRPARAAHRSRRPVPAASTEPTGRILLRAHAESAPAVIYATTDGYEAGGSCHAAPHGDVPTLFAASRTRLVSR